MSEDHTTLSYAELARWMVLAAILVASIGAYFVYGRQTEPLHSPGVPAAEESK
jgi:hypothetical protein